MKNYVKYGFRLEACRLRIAWRSTIAITFLFLAAQAVVAYSPISLPKDSQGWTVFTPSADSRIIYVSNSGNDGTGQYYSPGSSSIGSDPFKPIGPVNAFSTYSAAKQQARDGYPDWILFRRGDTFSAQIVPLSGRSDSEFALVGAYGSAGPMPVIHPASISAPAFNINAVNNNVQRFALTGLDFYSFTRDPGSASFTGTAGERGLLIYVASPYLVRQGLIEGCKFRFFHSNGLIAGAGSTFTEFVMRRNLILDDYSNGSGYSQGLWASCVNGFLLEENILDHNGWYSKAGSGGPGEATMFQHSTYFYDCHNVDYKNNILLRASSTHTKMISDTVGGTSNITIDGNLWVAGEVACSLGGNNTFAYRFSNMTVQNNVVANVDYDNPTGRGLGWGMDLMSWDGGLVKNNLFIDWQDPTVKGNIFAIRLDEGTRNVVVQGNIVTRMNPNGVSNNAFAFNIVQNTSTDPKSAITFTGNVIEEPTHQLGMVNVQSASDLTALGFSGNNYYASAQVFQDASTAYNFTNWVALTGESGSQFAAKSFSDATRSIPGYMTQMGQQGTIDAFIQACRAQGRYSWDSRFTADAVNSWLRVGFTVGGSLPGSPGIQKPSGIRLE